MEKKLFYARSKYQAHMLLAVYQRRSITKRSPWSVVHSNNPLLQRSDYNTDRTGFYTPMKEMGEFKYTLIVSIIHSFLLKYVHVIFLLLCVVIIRFAPFQVFNAMYPLFISIDASFGIPALAVIAPFLCNLTLATSMTPFNSATYVGCNPLQINDVDNFIKKVYRL